MTLSTESLTKGERAKTVDRRQGLVLVVDDEPELAEMLVYALNQHGYAALVAEDGFSACRLIESERPDLILLDVMMPALDGWEVCRLLRSVPDEQVATIPVVMLTALGALDDRLRGLELGADAYLPKPYALREVLALADNLIARRHREQAQRCELERLRTREQLAADIQALLFHELRNQLMVIGGFSNLLARSDLGAQPLRTRDYLQAIHRSSDYLGMIAEEFQMVRGIEDGKLTLPLDRVDLEDLLLEVFALFRPLAQKRGVTLRLFKLEQPLAVQAHRAALKVVIANLVDNAVKYSSRGQAVDGRCLLDDDGWAGVEIRDTGPGIVPEEQELVFRKFCRGRTGTEQSRGSGLGLYVVRILVEALGGQVRLDSRPGDGSNFQVRLPLAEAAQSA